ncbi:MAG: glycosyltransferase [Lachnospiraceae bacterium]|nr:glycosyltransferase [Lachnospiraceae bacterium]
MVSVIVPIYKVEAYLEKCIKSIQSQTYAELEIILVNDGSPDGCGAICDKYAETDNRIRVIHKENGGLSDARNKGLDIATGDYVLFVDSDDYIHPQMVEILLYHLEETEADMAVCGFKQVEEKAEVVFPHFITGKTIECTESEDNTITTREVFEGQAVMNNLQYKNLLTVVAWNKLYKAELFEKIRYPKGRIHEDEFLTHWLLHLCKKTVYTDAELYYYLQRNGSIMGEIKYNGVRDGWKAYEERLAFLKENGYEQMALFTKLHMMHYICKFYHRLERNVETKAFLNNWHEVFVKLYEEKEVQALLTKEELQRYKYFVIRPQLYYNKKIKAEKREAFVKKIKQVLRKYVKR